MRYQPTPPPEDPRELRRWLYTQLQLLGFAIDSIRDGEVENALTEPEGTDEVLIFSDGELEFGQGAGMYLRLQGDAWYKLQMTRVHPMWPGKATLTITTGQPTVTSS